MNRRTFLGASLALAAAGRALGQTAPRPKGVIWLWMGGGMSQLDTFDPKPGNGELGAIDTSVPGVRFSAALPRLAAQMKHLALIRSMRTGEGAHDAATFLMHAGFGRVPGVDYPSIGTVVARELGAPGFALPKFIAIDPPPLPSGAAFPEDCRPCRLPIPNLDSTTPAGRERDRDALLREQSSDFEASRDGEAVRRLREGARDAERLRTSPLLRAFDVLSEPAELRARYGGRLGQNCLLARRLVEAGVPFVEIGFGGWDVRDDSFNAYRARLPELDAAAGTLIEDLQARGRLDDVLVVLATEFGRTPDLNAGKGRDHWTDGFSVLLAGAGLRRGVVHGSTGPDGRGCLDPVTPAALFATIYAALGIDARKSFGVAPEPTRDTYVWPATPPLRDLLR